MTLPTTTKNSMLDALTITDASLHNGFPGSTGLNEISGGSYARQAVTVGAAAGGIRALSAGVDFLVTADTVRWVGFWNSTTFVGCAPNGGATPKNFIAVSSSDLIYAPSHGWLDDQKIAFYQGTAPSGLTEGTVYFVRDATTDSFKVAATAGGVAIALASAASFGCVVAAITEDTYVAMDTHTLATASIAVPD